MPRHPPIALKTLDRSHCQYPPARSQRDRRFSQIPKDFCFSVIRRIIAQRDLEEIVASAQSCAGLSPDVIGTKRPASRDRFEGAVRQTHHMREIERLPRQITPFSGYEVRTNLLFTMSYRTGGEPRSSPQIFIRTTLPTGFHLYSTPFFRRRSDNPCGLRGSTILRIAKWWSRTGSNRRHPACKAGALPAELRPLDNTSSKLPLSRRSTILADCEVVGLGGLEPPTSRLSSARSNQLSYKP